MLISRSLDPQDQKKRINEMIDCPKLYLIGYFDDLKSKVDIEFAQKIKNIQSKKEKEETNKKWNKIIEIIEECQRKCLKNKISDEMRKECREQLATIESKQSQIKKIYKSENEVHEIIFNNLILTIKNKLESFLFANDSCLAIFIQRIIKLREVKQRLRVVSEFNSFDNSDFESEDEDQEDEKNEKRQFISFEQILIIEEGFQQTEIESLLNEPYKITSKFSDANFNILKMKYLVDCIFQNKEDTIIYLESFSNIQKLQIDFKQLAWSDLSDLKGPKLRADFLTRFINLTNLSLDEFTIENLNAFSHLIHLESLGFHNVNVTHFETISLLSLTKLIELELDQCDIQQTSLNCQLQLKTLRLGSDITYLLKNNFYGFQTVEILYLNRVYSCSFEKGWLTNMPYLKQLKILYFGQIELDENKYNGLNYLEELCINDSVFKSVELGCFNGLKSLKRLDLSKSRIDLLIKDIFVPLENLEILILDSDKIFDYEEGCFNGLNQLKQLTLKNEPLSFRSNQNIFVGLENLEELKLSGTACRLCLERGYLSILTKLKVLCLKGFKNYFNVRKNIFIGLKCLEELYLNEFFYIDLEPNFFNGLNSLLKLNLSKCSLIEINGESFRGLENLKELKFNMIIELKIGDGSFNPLVNLKHLSFVHCKKQLLIKKDSFVNLKNLERLFLCKNKNFCLEDGSLNGLCNLKCLKITNVS